MSELEKRPDNAVAAPLDYGQHYNQGFDNQTKDDLVMPFLTVLQGGEKGMDDVPAAKPGLLFNTVTRELYESVLFVPAITERWFNEWIPRKQGGGFVGRHRPEAPEVVAAMEASTEFGKYKLPNGNELAETFNLYGSLCDAEQALGFCLMSFTSTKIKVYKAMNTRMQMLQVPSGDGRKRTPPMFAHVLRVGTVAETNALGEYFNFTLTGVQGDLINGLMGPDDARFKAGLECYTLVRSGKVKVADPTAEKEVPF